MNRRRKGRVFAVSFAVTLAALSGIAVFALYASPSGPQVSSKALPSQLPTYQADWAKYAPAGALQVSYYNYSLVRQLNSSVLPIGSALHLVRPNATLSEDGVETLVTIGFSQPNESVDIAFLSSSAFNSFSGLITNYFGGGHSSTPAEYYVETSQAAGITTGWLALVPADNVVEFAAGSSAAKQVISYSLQAANGTIDSVLQDASVRQMLYIAGGVSGHISLGIQNFPGVVRTGQMTLIAVDKVNGQIQISYVVMFHDAATAQSQVSYMETSYLLAHAFNEYGQYLQAMEYQPLSQLEGAMRLVG